MSYSIWLGSSCIWSPSSVQQNSAYALLDIQLELELNKSGSLTFTIYPDHPYYSLITKLASVITVKDGSDVIFRGRAINDTLGWQNERVIVCEGELAYLYDSIQRPFSFPQSSSATGISDYLSFLLTRHNAQMPSSKQITLGTVTVTDSNNYVSRSDSEYSTTWDLIQEGLLDTYGGYLNLRHGDDDELIMDYLADLTTLGTQSVQFGSNLLSISTTRNAEDTATAILPLGGKDETTGERITISSLPDDATVDFVKSGDIVYSASKEASVGRILKVVTWDDVTVPSNLLTKARAKLGELVGFTVETTLTAADLAYAGYNVSSFHVGTVVTVTDTAHGTPHGLSNTYLVKKLSIPILSPESIVLTIGSTMLTYTEENAKAKREEYKEIEAASTADTTAKVRELEQRVNSSIQQSASSILSSVSDEYYTKDETDTKVSGLRTTIEQNANSVNLQFEGMQSNLDAVSQNVSAEFETWRKYIRFVDGNIVLGEEGNQITLRIENDIIQFLEGGNPVAYFSDNKLFVTDAEILQNLRLGKFGFIPRDSGNLDFKVVT